MFISHYSASYEQKQIGTNASQNAIKSSAGNKMIKTKEM